MATFLKDPTATLDYALDWAAWLATDTIASSNWVLPTDLTLARSEITPTQAIAWISGGVVGHTYNVVNTITTTAGREDSRSITISVGNR